ncbi:MAG: arabinose efflux permease family protein [Acidimicrobiales bacterium]|nr:arabinose efflux permease family protein [Acidimicrobiales bacterium]
MDDGRAKGDRYAAPVTDARTAAGSPAGEEPDPCLEDIEDASLEGDRPFTPGTARAAFSHRTFRVVYLGALASNVGTWMQNVVLGALAFNLTHSGVFVGIVTAAQLGPLLLFSIVGGMLADSVDRKRLLISLTVVQAAFSVLLGLIAFDHSPSKVLLVAVVLAIGIGNALYAPVFSAVLPVLVPREDIAGAISLNSVQMNASRVVGPAIGTFLYARYGASWVFFINAASYAAVIAVLLRVQLPKPPASGSQGLHRLLEGVRAARSDRVVGQCLIVIFVFSFFCLPFITQMPKIAGDQLGIAPKSSGYGLLYASFGLGAVTGALSIGTVFAHASKAKLTRIGLVGFAVLLTVFGFLRSPTPAYPVIFALGTVYFAVITSLSTVLQQDLPDAVRGKVMALWIMGFGGTVPFGGLAGGVLMEHTSISTVLAGGAIVALLLAWWTDFKPHRLPAPA